MSSPSTEELERRIALITGELSTMGIALHALLKYHPHRDEVAAEIHNSYEQMVSRTLASPFPDAFLEGMKSCRDLYLLKGD